MGFENYLYAGFFAVLLILHLFCALGMSDRWPISGYPMFSYIKSIERILVLRVALIRNDGRTEWWKPKLFYYERDFGGILIHRIFQERDGKVGAAKAYLTS